jgi:ribosomal protein S18 acetylase RimI-like enzyme
VTVRRATPADAVLMRQLWDAFTAETTYTPYPGMPFAEAMLSEHVALLAEEDGRPVGTVYANLGSEHFGYVFGLYVVPAFRERGLGRTLMAEIAQVLVDAGRLYVLLSVDTPNERARSLYESLGFVDAARMLRAETAALTRLRAQPADA